MGANTSSPELPREQRPPHDSIADALINPIPEIRSNGEDGVIFSAPDATVDFQDFEPLEVWAQSQTNSCVAKHKGRIQKLGLSWETIHLLEEDDIVRDLVGRGSDESMTLFDARCIVALASKELARRTKLPLGVFWDLNSATMESIQLAERMKAAISAHGTLKQFRGYFDYPFGRKEVQNVDLAGCSVINCKDYKESIGSIISMDAILFASSYPGGATVCIISERADASYQYLFGCLKQNNIRAILVSQISLLLNGKLRFKDSRSSSPLFDVPLTPSAVAIDSSNVSKSGKQADLSSLPNNKTGYGTASECSEKGSGNSDDLSILRSAINSPKHKIGKGSALKAHVLGFLRENHSKRFGSAEKARDFIAQAIEKGMLSKSGSYNYEMLSIPPNKPELRIFQKLPIPFQDLSENAISKIMKKPLALIIDREQCPRNVKSLTKGYFERTKTHCVVMCASVENCLEIKSSTKWLRNANIYELRDAEANAKTMDLNTPTLDTGTAFGPAPDDGSTQTTGSRLGAKAKKVCCRICKVTFSNVEAEQMNGSFCCHFCTVSLTSDRKSRSEQAVARVTKFMKDCFRNDEVWIKHEDLRKVLMDLYPDDYPTPFSAGFGIHEANKAKIIIEVVRDGTLVVCFPQHLLEVSHPMAPPDVDTSAEETYLCELVAENDDWIERDLAMGKLKAKFNSMATRTMRCLVLKRLLKRKLLYVARSSFGQTIGTSFGPATNGLRVVRRRKLGLPMTDETTDVNGSENFPTPNDPTVARESEALPTPNDPIFTHESEPDATYEAPASSGQADKIGSSKIDDQDEDVDARSQFKTTNEYSSFGALVSTRQADMSGLPEIDNQDEDVDARSQFKEEDGYNGFDAFDYQSNGLNLEFDAEAENSGASLSEHHPDAAADDSNSLWGHVNVGESEPW